jgi:6-phosphogluconolactonase (cycloisomerase 2 family)
MAQFAYVANLGDNTVSGYSIDRKTGALTPVPTSPFATGYGPTCVAVDPTGQFVYVTGTGNSIFLGTVSGYSIDRKTGVLTPVPGSPFAATPGTFVIAVDPTARFAYVATSDSTSTVLGYRIDRKTGTLTPIPGSPFGGVSTPQSVAVDPTAQFVYVANADNNTVSGYSIDRKTGALTPIPGSPFAAGSGPVSVEVDPTAQFAYVVNILGSISGYSIDRKTGALTPVPGSPFATGGGNSRSIAITRH